MGVFMLQQVLSDFVKIEGVNAAVIVGRDGFIVDQCSDVNINVDALGAMASTSVGMSMAMGNHLDMGICEQVLVELENGPVILSLIGQNEILAVVARQGANIGRIRYEIRKNKDRIAAALYVLK
jgi:predicted regulator of Ras-like GTPase activity (Roadblock/LC7/MglB family)